MLEVHLKDDVAEVLLYDVIGSDFFGDGISAKDFAETLQGITAKTINLRINSPGGIVFEGYAMYESLRRHKARVEVSVDGVAASAASVVAMAGEKITMGEASMMMIHNPWGGVMGESKDMRAYADLLDKVRGQVIDLYAKRSKDKEQLGAWMDATTYFTGQEAVDAGLADEISGDGTETKAEAFTELRNGIDRWMSGKGTAEEVKKLAASLIAPKPDFEGHRRRKEVLAQILASGKS